MGKIKMGSMGFLANTTHTKEVWINGTNTSHVSITTERKKSGRNYKGGSSCIDCNRPREIRGNLCIKCRDKILEEAKSIW